MADKMTDEGALAVLTKWADTEEGRCNHSGKAAKCPVCVERRDSIAHIAARLGGGEGVKMCPCGAAPVDECPGACGPANTTPPARLAATAVGVTEEMVESASKARIEYFSGLPDSAIENPTCEQADGAMRAALEAALANQTKD